MKQKNMRVIHKCLSFMLAAAMLLTMHEMTVHARTAEPQARVQREMPSNPVHHCNKEDGDADTTDWSYVYFGSYPQAEVTGDALTPAITGASYDENGDAWVNGEKYRRISKSDTTYDGHFGEGAYRYFKFKRIKWRVLQNDGSTLFVVADLGLDCKTYYEPDGSVTWEGCELRKWMNNFFYQTAFTSQEQEAIVQQNVANEDNPNYGTRGGNDTTDKVYLLSIGEVLSPSYGFCSNQSVLSASRWFKTSEYAYVMGAAKDNGSDSGYAGNCTWWLRSPGMDASRAANVSDKGMVYLPGSYTYNYLDAVVPALHIDLSSNLWSTEDDGSSGEVGGDVVDTMTDYKTNVSSFMENKGTLNSIKYLCADANFTNSVYVHENDEAFADDISMELSKVYYRNMDGWKDLFAADTSREEAEKILAALLQDCQKDAEQLARAKNAGKYARYFVQGLKDYVKTDAVISSVGSQEIEKMLGIVTEQKIQEMLIGGEYARLPEEFQKLGGYPQDSEAVRALEDYMSSENLADILSKGLDFLGEGLAVSSITRDTFDYLYQLESLMDADEAYSEMLLYLQDNCSYDVARDAAGALYHVVHGAYEEQSGNVVAALKNAAAGSAFDAIVDQAAAALPFAEIIKKGFDWDGTVLNFIFQTDDAGKLKDNMRIIAYVGNSLSLWALDNQKNFSMASTDIEKNAYARKLYYSLHMIWNTRKAGEETLQRMFRESDKRWGRYYTLSLQTSSALDSVKNSIFTDNMEETIKSVTVSGPADVILYDADGAQVLLAEDGKESSGCAGDVFYSVKYHKVDDDYVKILCFPDNREYTIKCVGKDLGTLDAVITGITEEGKTDRRYFENVAIGKDTVITINSVALDLAGYTVVDPVTGEGKTERFQSEPEVFVPAAGITLSESKLELRAGDRRLLAATVSPDNATEKKVIWNSSDESVAVVNSDGVVTAAAEGKAEIFCSAWDDPEVTASCEVTVSVDTECTHQNTEVRNRVEPTCSKEGYAGDTYCKDCNVKMKTGQALKKTPHAYVINATKATTASNGSMTEKCRVCGNVKDSRVISAVKSVSLKATSYTYDGKAKRPSVKVLDTSGKAVGSSNYTVTYKNNKEIGRATVTIVLKGNYAGIIFRDFEILPRGTSISGKVAARSKGFLVKWKKQKKAITGYEVQYSANRKFKKKTTVIKTVKKKSAAKLTVGNLKPGKKYYVRVRTYKTVKGKKYCSAWSKSRTVTIGK